MTKEYSPFTPGVPVPIDFFVGRIHELSILTEKAKAATQGRLQRVFVYGERGIGKSSLCQMARVFAERESNVLGVHVFLGGVTSLTEMTRRIFDRLIKDSIDRPWYEKVKYFLGKHVKEVGLLGNFGPLGVNIEFKADEKELEGLVNGFAVSLGNLIQQLKDTQKGLMIILDDLNGLANSLEFANWLKSLVDEIATSGRPLPLVLVLVGLPERRSQLFQAQPSLARVFDPVKIEKLSEIETKNFYKQSYSQVGVNISDEALEILWHSCGGYPALAHEIGDAVFKIDSDNYIDRRDAGDGILKAADVIGQKYIEPQVFDVIRSEKYRSILRKLAKEPLETEFRKKEAIKNLDDTERKVFDNFLQKMKKLHVLVENKDLGSGGYQFTSDLHQLFFWLQAQRAQKSERRSLTHQL